MFRWWIAAAIASQCLLATAAPAQPVAIEKKFRVGPLGKAILSIEGERLPFQNNYRLDAAPAPLIGGNARLAMVLDGQNEVGLSVRRGRSSSGARSASAVVGLWGNEGSVELGAFQHRPDATATAGAAGIVQMVSGRNVRARGVKLTGSLHSDRASGWKLALDARHQRTPDYVGALRGVGGTAGESRLSLTGKLEF